VILDTNALSAYADGVKEAVAVVDTAPSIEVPVIALGEYRFGLVHSRRRQNYEAWLMEFLQLCRVLTITEETTYQYAQLRSDLKETGRPIPSNDLWIAALSRQYGMPILSQDRHFDAIKGLRRIGW